MLKTYVRQNFVDFSEPAIDADNLNKIAKALDEIDDRVIAQDTEINKLKSDLTDITPDDTQVDGKPWTSKHIVDTLCQSINASGNPVRIDGVVEHYPLGVTVSLNPVQEGSGDPSPENIRPITGRNAVKLIRYGKNLIDYKKIIGVGNRDGSDSTYGDNTSLDDDKLTITYAYGQSGGILKFSYDYYFPMNTGEKVTISFVSNTTVSCIIGISNYYGGGINNINSNVAVQKGERKTLTLEAKSDYEKVGIFLQPLEKDTVLEISDLQVEFGSTETAYEPYISDTFDITLPEMVYGGELNLDTGILTITNRLITLSGNENWMKSGNYLYCGHYKGKPYVAGACSHFPYNYTERDYAGGNYVFSADWAFIVGGGIGKNYTVSEWKAFLLEQAVAGTPVQVSQGILEPYTIELTPQQITALSGTNTIYTDADRVTVAGRENPQYTITQLQNAIISLGGNI